MSASAMQGDASDVHFVACVRNDDHELALALHRLYAVLPDVLAEGSGWIRIIGQSGEDHLRPENLFRPVDVPDDLREELLRAS